METIAEDQDQETDETELGKFRITFILFNRFNAAYKVIPKREIALIPTT